MCSRRCLLKILLLLKLDAEPDSAVTAIATTKASPSAIIIAEAAINASLTIFYRLLL